MEKKFKFEVTRLGIFFIVLFALCLLVWTFILGVWIGTKIGEKPSQLEQTAELKPPSPAPAIPQMNIPQMNASAVSQPPSNQTTTQRTTPPATPASEEIKKEEKPSVAEKPKEKAPPKAESIKEQKKEEVKKVAKPQEKKIEKKPEEGASGPFYALQVGAFTKRELAEKAKADVEKLGFKALLKEETKNNQKIYKVLAGRFESREKALAQAIVIESALGIKPFPVEVK